MLKLKSIVTDNYDELMEFIGEHIDISSVDTEKFDSLYLTGGGYIINHSLCKIWIQGYMRKSGNTLTNSKWCVTQEVKYKLLRGNNV